MHYRIMEWLVCPSCRHSAFRCVKFKEARADGELEDGLLICTCGESYPVISGVPRLLPSQLHHSLHKDYGWFFEQYADQLNDQRSGRHQPFHHRDSTRADPSTLAKERTAQSFGYEWNQFSRIMEHYQKNFEHYFEGFSTDFFQGKLVLDVGCGMGRHSYYAALNGAEVIGLDLSSAIDAAQSNNCTHQSSHFIQGDLYHMPLRTEQFDLVYCLGVLHHLPDPEAGFRELLKYVKPDGLLHIYVYHKLDHAPYWHRILLAAVTRVRRFTTKMPYPLLKRVCFLWAGLFYLGLIIPARGLKRFPRPRSLVKLIPLHRYAESPFHAIYKDTFDRFSAPLESRYSRQDVLNWFLNCGATVTSVLGGSGWRITVKKTAPLPIRIEESCAESVAN